nr:MAG TPA: hypothetical protein [Caudoviricetes sp.]
MKVRMSLITRLYLSSIKHKLKKKKLVLINMSEDISP